MGAPGTTAAIPAWDVDAGCYRFYTVTELNTGFKPTEGTGFDFKFRYRPIAKGGAAAWQKNLADGTGITINIDVVVTKTTDSREGGEGSAKAVTSDHLHYNFVFDDRKLIDAWLGNPTGSSFVLSGTMTDDVTEITFVPEIHLDKVPLVIGASKAINPPCLEKPTLSALMPLLAKSFPRQLPASPKVRLI